jgi:hypothetical protein
MFSIKQIIEETTTQELTGNKGIEIGKTADFLLKIGIKCIKFRFL